MYDAPPPHLEVDDDEEDDDGSQQVGDVGQVGPVERLLQRPHLRSFMLT